MNLVATQELARIQSLLFRLRQHGDSLQESGDLKEFQELEAGVAQALEAGIRKGVIAGDLSGKELEVWHQWIDRNNTVQAAILEADRLAVILDHPRLAEAVGESVGHLEPEPIPCGKNRHLARGKDHEVTLNQLKTWVTGLEKAPRQLLNTVELADRQTGTSQDKTGIDNSENSRVQYQVELLKQRLNTAQRLIVEHERQSSELQLIEALVDGENPSAAQIRLDAMPKIFSDLDYKACFVKIDDKQSVLEDQVATLRRHKHDLEILCGQISRGGLALHLIPPFAQQAQSRITVTAAAAAISRGEAHIEGWPDSEIKNRLMPEVMHLRVRLDEFNGKWGAKLKRAIRGSLYGWLALVVSACSLAYVGEVLERKEIERGVLERNQWIESEEKEAQRISAVAKAAIDEKERKFLAGLGIAQNPKAGTSASVGGTGSVQIPVKWIPNGQFLMGSSIEEKWRRDNETQHEVILSRGFFMAETECTQAQWIDVMGTNPSTTQGGDLPVTNVSWEHAQDFCRKLTVLHQKAGAFSQEGQWELPTEAQWEYACRAGNSGAFSGPLETTGWFGDNSEKESHPVRTKQANAWGLNDMHGNVWEFCADRYGSYSPELETDPTGLKWGSLRVLRGGSWYGEAAFCRSAYRESINPTHSNYVIGFRPVLVLKK